MISREHFNLVSPRGEKAAEGCIFSDGSVAVRWMRGGYPNSSVWWNSFEDARRIHTEEGGWQIVFPLLA